MKDLNNVKTELKSAILSELREMKNSMFTDMNTIKSQLTDLNLKCSSLETTVAGIRSEVNRVTHEQETMYSDIDAIHQKVEHLQSTISTQATALDKLEAFSRRDNVVLYGVTEESDETHDLCKDAVISILNAHVKTKLWQRADIVRAHRLGARDSDRVKPRPIIAKFCVTDDKITALKHRSALKDSDIGIANDLTKLQREELSNLRSNGMDAYYKNGKLITKPSDRPDDSQLPRRGRRYVRARPGTPSSSTTRFLVNMSPATRAGSPAVSPTRARVNLNPVAIAGTSSLSPTTTRVNLNAVATQADAEADVLTPDETEPMQSS